MKKNIIRRGLAGLMMAATLFGAAGCSSGADTTGAGPSETDTQPSTNGGVLAPVADTVNDNYRTFYQIFVGSFADSNDDTVGDLRGIIEHFDYLNDGNVNSETSLGVQGIWLSPIFTSPTYHKYDAIDYYRIDDSFGTEDDLKELIELCNQRNVKLILDLAINHTSKLNAWFVKFKQARLEGKIDDPYYDFYTCVTNEEKVAGRTYQPLGNGWWYECNFSGDMPELNFDNDAVRQEMLNVAKHYLELGVDGFRFDAVKYIYYGDTEKSVDFWKWYMAELKKIDPDIYCVGECWSAESEIMEYYPAMNCFNFAGAQGEGMFASAAKNASMQTLVNYVVTYQENVKKANPEGMPMFFLSNHDMDRIAGALPLKANMCMAANLYLLAPGSPVIYYGEELGMRGSRGGANTDANRRLAMLWGDGNTVKDPVGTTYGSDKQIQSTVVSQMEDDNSLLRYYCKLLSVRHRYPAIARGDYSVIKTDNKKCAGYLISYEGEYLVVIHNNYVEDMVIDLAQCKELQGVSLTELCEVLGAGNATLNGTVLTIASQTSVVIR